MKVVDTMSGYARPIDRIREQRKEAAQVRLHRRRLMRAVIAMLGGILLVGLGLGFALSRGDAEAAKIPGVGDHWHAEYTVDIFGEPIAAFPWSDGDVHSHGDGFIHVHPHSPGTAGEAANLRAFFTSVGGELTNDSLRLPDGRTFTQGNGDSEPAEIRVLVNDVPISDWATYIPQDGEHIEFIVAAPEQ